MQVPQTHRSSLTDNADGERSETIIPKFLSKLKYKKQNMEEIIKPIKDYDGYYISNYGNVYCDLPKGYRRDRAMEHTEMHIIKPRLTKNGYARIYARNSKTNKRKDLYIHRLVAEYFVANPDNKKYVNHKDCVRDNNHFSNLEWCTAKENTQQTEKLEHIKRDEKGRYFSNFKYEI